MIVAQHERGRTQEVADAACGHVSEEREEPIARILACFARLEKPDTVDRQAADDEQTQDEREQREAHGDGASPTARGRV